MKNVLPFKTIRQKIYFYIPKSESFDDRVRVSAPVRWFTTHQVAGTVLDPPPPSGSLLVPRVSVSNPEHKVTFKEVKTR